MPLPPFLPLTLFYSAAPQKHALRDLSSSDAAPSEVATLVFQRVIGCVVVSNAWELPHRTAVRFVLPPAFEAFCRSYEAFYASRKHSSAPRKLTWLYHEGSAVVSAAVGKWRGDLLTSPLQVRVQCVVVSC
jgi:hypothetical protein